MKAKNWKETLIRAGRTFLQAFAGYIVTNLVINASLLTDAEAFTRWLVGFVGAAVAAGVAAVMNLPAKTE